jgi:hypothetical protein
MAKRLALRNLPDYLIVRYDVRPAAVILAEVIDGGLVDTSRIHAKPTLRRTARRTRWVGASIDLADLSGELWSGRLLSRSSTPGESRSHHPIRRVPQRDLGIYPPRGALAKGNVRYLTAALETALASLLALLLKYHDGAAQGLQRNIG